MWGTVRDRPRSVHSRHRYLASGSRQRTWVARPLRGTCSGSPCYALVREYPALLKREYRDLTFRHPQRIGDAGTNPLYSPGVGVVLRHSKQNNISYTSCHHTFKLWAPPIFIGGYRACCMCRLNYFIAIFSMVFSDKVWIRAGTVGKGHWPTVAVSVELTVCLTVVLLNIAFAFLVGHYRAEFAHYWKWLQRTPKTFPGNRLVIFSRPTVTKWMGMKIDHSECREASVLWWVESHFQWLNTVAMV